MDGKDNNADAKQKTDSRSSHREDSPKRKRNDAPEGLPSEERDREGESEVEPNQRFGNRSKREAAEELRYERLLIEVIYVRATREEKRRIKTNARAAHLSISRYLVSAALSEKPPRTVEERHQIEELLFLFRRIGTRLNQLAANTTGLKLAGAESSLSGEFTDLAAFIQSLVVALNRRL